MTADSTPLGATDAREGPRWALFAIIVSTFAVLCSAFLLLSSVPWENDGAASNDALTWDGLTAMLSTLLSAGVAGGVAAWVLTAQNRKQAELQRKAAAHQAKLQRKANAHQAELQRKANAAQQEEARKAREIQAAAILAEHIDTKWQLFMNGIDVEANLGKIIVPVDEIPHLRRLTTIWTAQLQDELIEQSGIHREDLRNAVLKFAEAIHWGCLHHAHHPISSRDPDGSFHVPSREAWIGQTNLSIFSHYIPDVSSSPASRTIQWLETLMENANAHGHYIYDVRPQERPTLGLYG